MNASLSNAATVVELPVLSGPRRSAAPAPAREAAAAAGLRVLVVEDCADAARVLATLLGLAGHEARIALDAEEALEALGPFRPQRILLDLNLPSIDGLELARRLRRGPGGGEDPVIIALTAERGAGVRDAVLRAGCDHYMAKPVNFEQLCRLLAQERGSPREAQEPRGA